MLNRQHHPLVVTLVLIFCALSASPGTSAGRSAEHLPGVDWWEWTAPQLLHSSHRPEQLDINPPDELSTLDPAHARNDNEKAWCLELLGRSNDRAAIPLVAPYALANSTNVRASAVLALGRLGAFELAATGLRDTETVTWREWERVPGETGHALYLKPVALAALKGLSEYNHDAATLPYLLTGLHSTPIREVQYDSTPEPFPDLGTESNPQWYQNAVAYKLRRLGPDALSAMEEELKKPDSPLTHTSGGRFGPATLTHPPVPIPCMAGYSI